MDKRFRSAFNTAFTDEIYHRYSRDLCGRLNSEFPFRLAETPVFIPDDLRKQLVDASEAIVAQLSDPGRIEGMKAAIPPEWDTPGMHGLPSLTQVDFAIVRDANGRLVPRLIELQGFPSLTAMQVIQTDAWADTMKTMPGLDQPWSCWFSKLGREGFLGLAQRTIVGDHDPENVILMDLDPPSQKTWPDFSATKILFDVDAVCPTDLVRKGRKLCRKIGKRLVPVDRIYNRVVFDELIQKQVRLPFDYREELDVEWAPHPNWYWIWSKYSIPFLDHPTVPKATFVADLKSIPDDLEQRYVLKPLFSFAGLGVNVEPKREDIEAIPEAQRHSWCIQEKIVYAPALEAVDGGGVKVEIRLMFLRPDDEPRPILAQNLCRLSRGKMLGVDFNKDFTWVGSSVGMFVE